VADAGSPPMRRMTSLPATTPFKRSGTRAATKAPRPHGEEHWTGVPAEDHPRGGGGGGGGPPRCASSGKGGAHGVNVECPYAATYDDA